MEDNERALLEESVRIGKENNRLLRATRRDAWFGFIFRLIFWIIVLFAPVLLYFLLQPYIDTFLAVYGNAAGGTAGGEGGGFTLPSAEDIKMLRELLQGSQ